MNYPTRKAVVDFTAILSIPLVTLYPCLFIYFVNVKEASFSDIFAITGMFLLIAVFIFLFSLLIFRKLHKAVLFTNIFMFFAENYIWMKEIIVKLGQEI